MPSARYIVTLLVAAQIVAYSIGDLTGRVRVGLIDPFLRLIGGSDDIRLLIGPFDIGTVLGGLLSCLVSILLGLLLLRLVFRFAWRWIGRLIPEATDAQPSHTTPSSHTQA
jgi:hypothetical protein